MIRKIMLLLVCMAWPALAQDNACNATGSARLWPVMSTHTLPPYPRESVRHNEQGITLLRVKIAPDGAPFAALVEHSSGSARLDDAAATYVKEKWRWSVWDCRQDRVTQVSVNWKLKNSPGLYIRTLTRFAIGLSMLVLGFTVWKSTGEKSPFAVIRNLSDKRRRLLVTLAALLLLAISLFYLAVSLMGIAMMLTR